MLWMWVAIGVIAWLVAAVAVGIVLARMVRMRDHLERPRAQVVDAAEHTDARRSAHRAS